MKVVQEVTEGIEAIDATCRFNCWHAVLQTLPSGRQWDGFDLSLMRPLLGMTVYNHILRSIDHSGFDQYKILKRSAVQSIALGSSQDRRWLDQWVDTAVIQCAIASKEAASQKIQLYQRHLPRKDISKECRDGLLHRIEKNKRYLQIRLQSLRTD